MASRISVRQVSQTTRSNRLHLQPSRLQHYSSQSLFRAPSTARIRPFPTRQSTHFLQQTRNLSLWGSSTPKPESTVQAAPASNVNILEPAQFESVRTVKATDTSSDLSHNPNSFEPQFIEDVQQSIAQPHGTEAAHVPLEQIPERIGYLYEVCGIDFGWGPSSMMQWILEHIHIVGDLSWTSSIIVMSVGIRSFLIPFMIMSAKESTKLKLMTNAVKPIQEKLAEAKGKQDQMKVAQYSNEMRIVAKAHGVKWSRMLMPIILQFPLGFAAWRNLRNCATLPVPGFVTESWLWNVDLTFSDAYFAVPAASAFLIWASLKVNSNVAATTGTAGMGNADAMKLLKAALPALSFCFMVFQPGAVQLYFLCSSAMGLLTTWTMSLNGFRRFFGLSTAANPTAAPTGPAAPTVGGFMRQRENVVDIPARTISEADAKASTQAQNQNISFIDRKIGNAKSTFKGAFGALAKQGTEYQKKTTRLQESAQLREEIERARRERNANFGGQQEKKKGR